MKRIPLLMLILITLAGLGMWGCSTEDDPKPAKVQPTTTASRPDSASPTLNICLSDAQTKATAWKEYQEAQQGPRELTTSAVGKYELRLDLTSAVYAAAEKRYQECLAAELAPPDFFEDPCATARTEFENAKQETETSTKAAWDTYQAADSASGKEHQEYWTARKALLLEFRQNREEYFQYMDLDELSMYVDNYEERRALRQKSSAIRSFEDQTQALWQGRKERLDSLRAAHEKVKTEGRAKVAAAEATYDQCLRVHFPERPVRPCAEAEANPAEPLKTAIAEEGGEPLN